MSTYETAADKGNARQQPDDYEAPELEMRHCGNQIWEMGEPDNGDAWISVKTNDFVDLTEME